MCGPTYLYRHYRLFYYSIQSSYYIDDSTVTYSPGKVENFEKLTYQTLPCGYGKDTGGCKTLDILQTVVNRFGSVYSFSGSYRANTWTLNINRENTDVNYSPSSVTPSQTIITGSYIMNCKK